jgi:hypothetical protein
MIGKGGHMKKPMNLLIVMAFIAVSLVSCNLPLYNPPQETEPAPNLTLTALFEIIEQIPATVTPAAPTPQSTEAPTSAATLAPTAQPTNTPVYLSPTPEVKQRGGTLMKAVYLSTPPVMDGTYEEWVEKTYKYAVPYVVWQKANWKDAADLEGAFAAVWDDNYLYISVKVTDDIFVQNKSGESLYLGDSVEILIDAELDNDFYSTTLSQDDYQFGISPGNPAKSISKEVYLWYPVAKKGTQDKVLVSSLFEISPIYRIEIAIPWSLLEIKPTNGLHIGFAVSVSDNDKPGENVQDTMISTARYRNLQDPTTWGELVLVKSK